MAKRLAVSAAYVTYLENGDRSPSAVIRRYRQFVLHYAIRPGQLTESSCADYLARTNATFTRPNTTSSVTVVVGRPATV